mmetsp:Transcript_2633/g.9156  ORF Transcript_2633/g.9156 Transcript_2633/m.9156 type:complete len:246 (+) Transcript_2633:1825-2562(+)
MRRTAAGCLASTRCCCSRSCCSSPVRCCSRPSISWSRWTTRLRRRRRRPSTLSTSSERTAAPEGRKRAAGSEALRPASTLRRCRPRSRRPSRRGRPSCAGDVAPSPTATRQGRPPAQLPRRRPGSGRVANRPRTRAALHPHPHPHPLATLAPRRSCRRRRGRSSAADRARSWPPPPSPPQRACFLLGRHRPRRRSWRTESFRSDVGGAEAGVVFAAQRGPWVRGRCAAGPSPPHAGGVSLLSRPI